MDNNYIHSVDSSWLAWGEWSHSNLTFTLIFDFHFVSQTWTTLISTQWTPAGSPGENGATAVSRAAMGTGTEVEDAQVVEESPR